ncbi:pantoate-beta-alanine ligase [Sporothrix eucalyptigena]|uniref:Pantoate--beta-alanine ligase n=1 Tax=Sporothrix eucalyptigena TaxID=1812306 RepID=A0ABP0BBJ6_9PEZI
MIRNGVATATRTATRTALATENTVVCAAGRRAAALVSAPRQPAPATTRAQPTRPFHSSLASKAPAAAPQRAAQAAPATSAPAAEDGHDTIPGTSIRVFRTVAGLRAWRREQLLAGRTVGLVPTMGALHEGHLDLVRVAARDNDAVVISIYVNPTQFGVHEDLGSYPRTWDADSRELAKLQGELESENAAGRIEAVFAPTTAEMYPSGPPSQAIDGPGSFVTITPVGALLEGASRPTFFRGVATVCMKLFHIVQPERTYFGQKDVQQTVVLKRMVRDFAIPLELVVGPTVREQPDGLALSSRNVYLGTRRRAVANVLRRSLLAAAEAASSSPKATYDEILAAAHRVADETLAAQKKLPPSKRALFEIDYLSLSEADTMEELAADQTIDPTRGAILSGAVRMLPVEEPQPGEDLGHSGGPLVRLIDNIILEPTQGQ